jgi:phytoene synthase
VTAGGPFDANALAEAHKHCASLARQHARDRWLAALYASADARDGLLALASFDYEIRQARLRARDPNLAAMRLAWWRGVIRGERDAEAAGSPVALAIRAATIAFALPIDPIEAMLDARLREMASLDDFNFAAFEAFAAESEGAPLRLASRIASRGRDLDATNAHAPAGMASALVRMLSELTMQAGAAPTLFPVDVAARHGAKPQDFDARRASPGVIAACAELRELAREKLSEAERKLRSSPPDIMPAFIPLGALRLDLDRLGGHADNPFEGAGAASPLRRQWAIWRWARRQ